ncbi:MAG: flagellar biosynthesis protein FlhF [Desulfobacterales bacterium]
MQIKRYEAKNMTTALRIIKGELGPEAVILSARSIRKGKGFFGSLKYAGVEVTAAVDAQLADSHMEAAASVKTNRDSAQKIPPGIDHKSTQETKGAASAYAGPGPSYPKSYLARNRDESRNNRVVSSLYQQILTQEIDRGIASDLIEEIKAIPALADLLSNGGLKAQLVSILEEMGVWTVRNAFDREKPNIIALIGAAGVGKTTTLAKLAVLQTTRHKKRVALITLDNYGIADNEQLKTYARIIGVPLETAVNEAELKQAMNKFSHTDVILIDTPAISPADQNQILELKSLLGNVPNLHTHLVISAATKEKDIMTMVQALKHIGSPQLVFTKIDESSTFGNIFNVLIRTGLPLSFLSRGRRVPDDIEAGSVRKLVDLIFKSEDADRPASLKASDINAEKKSTVSGRTNKPVHFVANKNSDIYHCMDCKWSARIKAEHIIQFKSTEEAEAQNFLPCRSCKPDRRKAGQAGLGIAARLNLSAYTRRHN